MKQKIIRTPCYDSLVLIPILPYFKQINVQKPKLIE
jgi:hypothetical protein